MKEESVALLRAVNDRLTKLMKEVISLKEENSYLKEALDLERKQMQAEKLKVRNLQAELDSMNMVKAITGVEPLDKQARARINEMVKEIDRCIALMNN